jgi:hypothetical protein
VGLWISERTSNDSSHAPVLRLYSRLLHISVSVSSVENVPETK